MEVVSIWFPFQNVFIKQQCINQYGIPPRALIWHQATFHTFACYRPIRPYMYHTYNVRVYVLHARE